MFSVENQRHANQENGNLSRSQSVQNTIIKLIEFHHGIVNSIKFSINLKKTEFREGRLAFEFLYENYYRSFYKEVANQNSHLNETQIIDNAFSKLYQKKGSQFGFYFRNLYYVILYIDESHGIDKMFYTRLVRAQLSKSELLLLMYNCLSNRGNEFFKPLVEKYGLLKGIDRHEMIKPDHKDLFQPSAFI